VDTMAGRVRDRLAGARYLAAHAPRVRSQEQTFEIARRKQRRDQSRCESFHPRTYSSQWQHYGQVVDIILTAVSFI
jgi:hypothetical protein